MQPLSQAWPIGSLRLPHQYLSGAAISPLACIHQQLRPNDSPPACTGCGTTALRPFVHSTVTLRDARRVGAERLACRLGVSRQCLRQYAGFSTPLRTVHATFTAHGSPEFDIPRLGLLPGPYPISILPRLQLHSAAAVACRNSRQVASVNRYSGTLLSWRPSPCGRVGAERLASHHGVSRQALTLLPQVSRLPPPNRTYEFPGIRLSRV